MKFCRLIIRRDGVELRETSKIKELGNKKRNRRRRKLWRRRLK